MSYYKKASPVPWIAGVALLAAFVGIVVHYSSDDAPEITGPPLGSGRSMPAPAPEPVRAPPPEEERYEPPPPPKPQLSRAEAEKRLREATKEWRAFTVQLCRTQRWKSDRSVAFLKKVTWNDRDLEKQHENGLKSLRTMLGVQTTDPVALAEALAGAGSLPVFFERNWSKVDVAAVAEPAKQETVLEDMWKPNRVRWGFPLDTPVQVLEAFKQGGLAMSQRAWHVVAGTYIQGLDISETEKGPKLQAAIGDNVRTREVKLQAAFRVLMDKPDASLKDVVEEFVRRVPDREKLQEVVNSLSQNREKVAKALKAAEAAG
jgi:hypothetical protein